MPFLASTSGHFAFGRKPAATQTLGFNTSNLLLYLDAGNTSSYVGSGTNWNDLSSNGNNVSGLTGTTFNSSHSGYISFNGTTGSGALTSTKYNTPYTGKTVFAAMNLTSIAAGTFRALIGSGADNRNFNFYVYSPTINTYQLHFSAGGTGTISANMSYTPGNWCTVAVTHATDGTVRYYLNGVQFDTLTQTFYQYLSPSTEYIGRADNYWHGALAVICVYKTALTGAEIQANHNAIYSRYNPAVTANLVLSLDPSNSSSYVGSGTTINDMSSNPINGTLSNITFTNPYFSYNGSSSQVSIADNAKFEPGAGDWSMEAWFYTTAFKTGSAGVILGKFNNLGRSADVSYSIRTNSTGGVYAQFGDGSGSYVNSITYQAVLSTWAQIVFIWTNVATNNLEVFVNGVSQGSVSHSLPSLLNASNPIYLGSYNGGEYSQWFNGRIGITRLYNTALTSAQVQQNFNADRGKYGI